MQRTNKLLGPKNSYKDQDSVDDEKHQHLKDSDQQNEESCDLSVCRVSSLTDGLPS